MRDPLLVPYFWGAVNLSPYIELYTRKDNQFLAFLRLHHSPIPTTLMKARLLLPLLLLSVLGFSQEEVLRVEPANVVQEIVVDNLDESYQDMTTFVVTNNSRRIIQLVYQLRVGEKPRSWKYGVFNGRTSSTPYLLESSTGSTGRPVPLAPGQSATFFIVLEPDGISGSGRAEVLFSDLTIPGRTLGTASFATKILRRPLLNANAPSSAGGTDSVPTQSRPTPTTVRLYPNPAQERFFVEAPPGTKVGRVEVSNTLGRRLRRFDRPAGEEGYDIEQLPDGLYLISIYDDRGKKLKTLRLLHRRFGA